MQGRTTFGYIHQRTLSIFYTGIHDAPGLVQCPSRRFTFITLCTVLHKLS